MFQSKGFPNNHLDDRGGSNQYATFLDTIPWTHFATFTTKHILTLNATRRLANRIASKMPTQRNSIKMFWVGEQFKSGDGYHLHCLINCDREVYINQLKIWYEDLYGFCKILPKNGRASSYVTKCLGHGLIEYDII